jgi:hypothetical protein
VVSLKVDWDDGRLAKNIAELDLKTVKALEIIFAFQAAKSTGWMKTNAPWTDQTTAARSGLHATSSRSGSRFELVLAHAVSYGIWLEVCNSGKYQIILPALRNASESLQGLIKNLWSHL